MKRRTALALLFSGLALTLSSCGLLGDELPTYRYRLTVEVDTPEGLKSGSSVIEVRTEVADKPIIPDANTLDIRVTGEAVTIDIGKRGLLFALLRSDDAVGWAGGVMELVTPHPPYVAGENAYRGWHRAMLANKGLHELPRNSTSTLQPWQHPEPVATPRDFPMLVRFSNIADPTTVLGVDPDNLAAAFGQGVKLRRMTVELTDDPVTYGIGEKLGWLNTSSDSGLDRIIGVTANPTLAQRLSFLDFRKD